MNDLRQSTQTVIVYGPIWNRETGEIVDDFAHNETGVQARLWKNGTLSSITLTAGNWAASGDSYRLTLDDSNDDTRGILGVQVYSDDYYSRRQDYNVLSQAVYDVKYGAAALSTVGSNVGNVTGTLPDVVLAATQSKYAPAKAGDKMDLINTPNATALTAIKDAVQGAGTTLSTLLTRVAGTLASGTHNPQSGDAYAVVNHATHGNAKLAKPGDEMELTSDAVDAIVDEFPTLSEAAEVIRDVDNTDPAAGSLGAGVKDISGLSTFDASTDTVDIGKVKGMNVTGIEDFRTDVSGLSTFDPATTNVKVGSYATNMAPDDLIDISGIESTADKLVTTIEEIGSTGIYQFTEDALENAPAGGGGGAGEADWSTSEKKQIRSALGIAGDKLDATGGQLQVVKGTTDKMETTLQSDGDAGYQFTETALEEAPAGGGSGGGATAKEVWEYGTRSLTSAVTVNRYTSGKAPLTKAETKTEAENALATYGAAQKSDIPDDYAKPVDVTSALSAYGAAKPTDVVSALGIYGTAKTSDLMGLAQASDLDDLIVTVGGYEEGMEPISESQVEDAVEYILTTYDTAQKSDVPSAEDIREELESGDLERVKEIVEVLKYLNENKAASNQSETLYTYYEDDGTTVAGTQTWNKTTKTRGKFEKA